MKIFISHSQNDEKLALILKRILEEDKSIKHAFMFEKVKKYGVQIEKKITDEITQSDYLIAIITKNAIASASVNQEIGYAQAKNIERIPLIEKNAKEGFLIVGTEKITFVKSTFENKCREIRKYIINKGPRKKDEESFTQQELQVQKSAHFRKHMEYEIHNLFDSLVYRFRIDTETYRDLLFSSDIDQRLMGLQKLSKYMAKKPEILAKHIMKIILAQIIKFSGDYESFIHSLKFLQQYYPHDHLFPDEHDMLIQLKVRIDENDHDKFNLEPYLSDFLKGEYTVGRHETYEEIITKDKSKLDKRDLRRHINFYAKDLSDFVITVIALQTAFERIRKKYGDLGFKSTDTEFYNSP